MIARDTRIEILRLLEEFPAVGILGPRQIGKTTLAFQIAKTISPEPIYLDLESPSDVAQLSEPELYFEKYADRTIMLDEIQRTPEIFAVLQGVIDKRRRAGKRTGQFLILGAASLDLLQQSSESRAGRIATHDFRVSKQQKSKQPNLTISGYEAVFRKVFLREMIYPVSNSAKI